jgi:hypothetical protein
VKSVVYTGVSNSTGSFRKTGAGTLSITEISEDRIFQCYTAEPRIEVDRSEADRYENGPQAYIGGKGKRILDGELLAWAKQMYYGVSNNADGFPGLIASYDSVNMSVDAGGTTPNTGSSVWLLRVAPDGAMEDDGVRWRMGDNGRMSFDPVQLLPIVDQADSTKKYMAYVTAMTAYPAFQIQNLFAAVRIAKLTADAGKGLTDALINKALSKFLAGKGPNLILMNMRSGQQLQSSRTATNPTGQPAPWATSIVGVDGQSIPVKITEAISNTESLTL